MQMESGVQKLKKEIINKAEEEASELVSNAEERAENIKKNAQEKAEKNKQEIIDERREEIEQEKRSMMAEAKLKAKRSKLDVKEQLINEIIEDIKTSITNYSEQKKLELLQNLIKESFTEINTEKLIINANTKDLELIKENKNLIKEEIEETLNKQIEIEIGEKIDSAAGITATSQDKSITIDNTIEEIIRRKRGEIRQIVNRVCF
ncbi:V-type ATP synthase subunit E family protein [Methanonatronarchaeum sp. AMET-Sl]|uniref:V-type ATP synthase subunit E family protein n=1 Tax=Methanonatronarchaeum sp. AMET-Sl TaxID=3037654 RepID=UPI00244DA43F|nr:V-type ATP synthase subunit E family protein [Methanonatronarchaeum sp. AMET-Sl]WGI17460.1 V-type ATP synthase subunit E family protein [Methanonatronarchaeum sp. AMET-Sl]